MGPIYGSFYGKPPSITYQADYIETQQNADASVERQKEACDPNQPPCEKVIVLSDAGTESHDEGANTKAQSGDDEGTEHWPKFMGLHLKITDSLLALFTLALAIFTYQLVSSAQRQEEHFSITERAYVKLSHRQPPDIPPHVSSLWLEDDGRLGVRIKIMNHGNTPATVLRIRLAMNVFPGAPPMPPDYGGMIGGRYSFVHNLNNFLVRDDFFDLTFRFDPIDNSLAETIGAEGGPFLWVYGYVLYRDKFAQLHRGGYARRLRPGRRDNNLWHEESNYNYDQPEGPPRGLWKRLRWLLCPPERIRIIEPS